ncbi:MAG TPA: ribbon-helix-helix protein, CopG family [Chloroflexota bacterium]|nr:ribbon-helix-helix protein, CopG family [Chloroflexota bacterium]
MSASQGSRKRRSQIILDEDLYNRLVEEAEVEKRSVSSLVREAVGEWLESGRSRPIEETAFWRLAGQGHSGQSGEKLISENMDYYLYGGPNEASSPRLASNR